MSFVAIVDYGMCNLDSVARAVEECGGTPRVTDREGDIRLATRVILPGVGAFGDAMRNLRCRSLDRMLGDHILGKQIPLLGICLGMQLLASRGSEGGTVDGLGWIPGDVVRLQPSGGDTRIPHVGWNEVRIEERREGASPLFDGIASGDNFYFVHSYEVRCRNEADVAARTPYCGGFVSSLAHDLVFAVQFHPEKSQRVGFQLLKNFLRI